MRPSLSDTDFQRANEWYYLRSVRDAVEETYWASAWRPEPEVAKVLSQALERRGIEPEAEAVRGGAGLISRGRRPLILHSEILEPGIGRRRN